LRPPTAQSEDAGEIAAGALMWGRAAIATTCSRAISIGIDQRCECARAN
jgi:hypothetical protein